MPNVLTETKFTIYTSMGRSDGWSKLGLTSDQIKTLNDIGYGTNKNYSGFAEYLNTLDLFDYRVRCIQGDSGDFSETYEVIRVRSIDINEDSYTGYLSDIIDMLKKKNDQYVTITISDASDVLKKKEKEAKLSEKEELLNRIKQLDLEIDQL